MTFTSFKLVNRMTLDPHWPLTLLTSRHLFHDDLEVAILAERAQVFDDVSVTESTVQLDFFMKRLHFPNFENWANSRVRHVKVKVKEWRHTLYNVFIPTMKALWSHKPILCVFLWDFLDGDPDLCFSVTGCVHRTERAPPQHHALVLLVQFILVLKIDTNS